MQNCTKPKLQSFLSQAVAQFLQSSEGANVVSCHAFLSCTNKVIWLSKLSNWQQTVLYLSVLE